jgi:hypothetical protein
MQTDSSDGPTESRVLGRGGRDTMRPPPTAMRDKRPSCRATIRGAYGPWQMLGTLVMVLGLAAPAAAGGIAGWIKDAVTLQPIAGIDLDIYDSNFVDVPGINATSLADGTYLLSPLPAGQYYLRADPNVSQGYVDKYYPGVFYKSQATTVTVSTYGTVIVSFYLDHGGTISGTIVAASGGAPLAGIDLDVYDQNRQFLDGIDAASLSNGTFTLGCFPLGTFYVKADPTQDSMYVDTYYNGRGSLPDADPVVVTGVGNVPNINFSLPLGGNMSGTVLGLDTGQPLPGVDIDVFDLAGQFISHADATTDSQGAYVVGAVLPGGYYVQADPSAQQGYVDAYYGDVYDIALATPVAVTAGNVHAGIDIHLPRGGTISGSVTSAVTGLPVPGVRVTMFDALGSILPGAGGSTAADGSFLAGAVPSGSYLLRASGDPVLGLAFEFYAGVTLRSQATPVAVVAGSNTPGVTFALDSGGWITGHVRAADTTGPLFNVDLDVYGTSGEFIGALDAQTDPAGAYLLGPVPVGGFIVKADPTGLYRYAPQYYHHSNTFGGATPIQVTAGVTVPAIDFDVAPWMGVPPTESASLAQNVPNPFNPGTRIRFTLADAGASRLRVFDVSGRLVRTLVDGRIRAGRHEVYWNGLDSEARPVASGVYFFRLESQGIDETRRMILLK